MGITFEIEGQRYIAFNGGPSHPFNDTVSLYVDCEDQAEIDKLWSGLIANGGSPIQCGWLKDRFGLRWQIVPRVFMSLMNSPDPKKSKAVFQAMMKMVKFDIAGLQRAHDEA